MPLARGVIRAYDSANQTADVELVEAPRALMLDVPFVASFALAHRTAGAKVLLETYGDLGAIIIAAYGVSLSAEQGILQGHAYDSTARNFTAASWTTYTGLTFSGIAITQPSYLWLFAVINFTCSNARTLAGYFRWYANSAQVDAIAAFGGGSAGYQQTVTLAVRTPELSAGTYAAEVQGYCNTSGDTIAARYSSAGYMAVPKP